MFLKILAIASVVMSARQRVGVEDEQAESVAAESVPAEVTDAIRRASKNAQDAMEAAETRKEEHEQKEADAARLLEQSKQAAKQKNDAAEQATQKANVASEQARAAAQAAREAISSKGSWDEAVDANDKAQAVAQDAIKAHNAKQKAVNEEVERLKAELEALAKKMNEAIADAKGKQRTADEERIAYTAAQESDDKEVAELGKAQRALDEANTLMEQETLGAAVAAREAQEAQIALEDALAELNQAKEDLEAKTALKELLWSLYDDIDEFSEAVSALTKAMRKIDRKGLCKKKAHECMISEGDGGAKAESKAIVDGFNAVVLKFMTVKELYPKAFAEIQDAQGQIDKNALSEVALSCDPLLELENAADGSFDAHCGSGLWKAFGITKNRFYEIE